MTEPDAVAAVAAPNEETPPAPALHREFLRNALAEWAIVILALLFGTTALVQAFVIPSGSMEDTFLVGDHVLVDKLSYAPAGPISKYLLPYTEIKRGDIIVFRYPLDPKQTFVKRVVGTPGDRIRIQDKQLYRNGVKIAEPYVYFKTGYMEPFRDTFPGQPYWHLRDRATEMLEHNVNAKGELVVPANSYFAMGDNRDHSDDSRYWGFVPRQNIIGKPLMIYWSYDATPEQISQPGFNFRYMVDVAEHFFSRTRWQRTFTLIHGYSSNN